MRAVMYMLMVGTLWACQPRPGGAPGAAEDGPAQAAETPTPESAPTTDEAHTVAADQPPPTWSTENVRYMGEGTVQRALERLHEAFTNTSPSVIAALELSSVDELLADYRLEIRDGEAMSITYLPLVDQPGWEGVFRVTEENRIVDVAHNPLEPMPED